MNRLQTELRRLYLLGSPADDVASAEAPCLISPEAGVRAMVLELARPADWGVLSALWQGVQADLELPAPAIAVSGTDGYQLWFSLAEPVPVLEARRFLEFLRLRYLGQVAQGRIALWPAVDASAPGHYQHANMVPAHLKDTGLWSAFIAPDLAPVFSDEPWLDICPSPDAQADILSRLVGIKAADFQKVLARLGAAAKTTTSHMALATSEKGGGASDLAHGATQQNPKQFLLDVMGDTSIEMHLRIQAAAALLPYFENPPRAAS
jgi:hypothetical protein